MKLKTVGTILELVGIGILVGMADKAINEAYIAKKELTLTKGLLDLGVVVMDVQKNRIEKLEKEIKELKGEA